MAWTLHRDSIPKIVASAALAAYIPVKPLQGTADKVVAAASAFDYPLGFTIATGASAGAPLSIVTEGVVKAIAAASLGAGAEVGVGSSNGRLVPLASVAAASGLTKYVVGEAQNNAADGDTFSVMIRVRLLDTGV